MEKDCPRTTQPLTSGEKLLVESLIPDESMFNSDDKARNRKVIVGLARLDRKLEEMIKK